MRAGRVEEGFDVRHILIADDGSEEAWSAVTIGTELALMYRARATVTTVIAGPAYPAAVGEVPSPYVEQRHLADEVQRKAIRYARWQGLEVYPVVLTGHPAEAILDYARRHDVDLIVVGHRGQSNLRRFLGGSVSRRMVDHAHCMVLVVRGAETPPP